MSNPPPVTPYSPTTKPPVSFQPAKDPVRTEFMGNALLVVHQRGNEANIPPGPYEVGLLIKPPTPEGTNIVEPDPLTGYERQEATFVSAREGSSQRNRNDIIFEFTGEEAPDTHIVAVFIRNICYYYGFIESIPSQAMPGDPPKIIFKAGNLTLRNRRAIG